MNYLNYIEDHIEVWKSFMFLIFKVVNIHLPPSLSLLLTLATIGFVFGYMLGRL